MNFLWSILTRHSITRQMAFQLALLPTLLGHQTAVAQTRSPLEVELRGLLDSYSSDFNTPENYNKAVHELTTRSEFKPMLLEMLKKGYFEALKVADRKPSTEGIGPLSLRKDLSATEQKMFTDELERLWSDPKEYAFVNGAINLLANYPTPEHEDLVLRFLNRPQNQDYTLVASYKTLSKIGGPKSLEAMQRVAARLKSRNNPNFWFLPELDTHIAALETRLKQEAATGRPQTAPAASQPKTPSAANAPTAVSSETSPASATDWRVWLGLLGGLILVIALSCRVFRRKS